MSNQSFIGIDIGGTKISAAVVKNNEIISEIKKINTPDNSADILAKTLEIIESLKHKDTIALGIATAGVINKENTKIVGSTGNLPEGYNKIDFKNEIENKFKLNTIIENDANAAAYAEFKMGNGQGKSDILVITLGTGIGAGIIIDKKLFRGFNGAGAECGHTIISTEKNRRCTCGGWDCWEAYASGTGYATTANEMLKNIEDIDKHSKLKDKTLGSLTTYDIIEGIKSNDKFAIAVHNVWDSHVLIGLISLTAIFDPECIILSGSMAKFIDYPKLQKDLHANTLISKPEILHAKAENDAGIIGAALLAENKFGS